MALRVLIVDDEKTVRRFLKVTLTTHDCEAFEAVNGKEALEYATSWHPDVIILDLGLPDIDGINVTKEIRKRSKVPIIILSVRDDQEGKVKALDAGADDYLTKPFDVGEMMARIRAVIRRLLPENTRTRFEVRKLAIDIAKHNVEVKGQSVHLTPTEYDVLKLLVLNAGKVLTHGQILKEIWNKTEDFEGVDHLLRVTISNLRNKIETDANRPEYVLTEPGVGYRLYMD